MVGSGQDRVRLLGVLVSPLRAALLLALTVSCSAFTTRNVAGVPSDRSTGNGGWTASGIILSRSSYSVLLERVNKRALSGLILRSIA